MAGTETILIGVRTGMLRMIGTGIDLLFSFIRCERRYIVPNPVTIDIPLSCTGQ